MEFVSVDADRARAFVQAQGSARDQARLGGIFGHSGPDRAVVKALEALQNSDGGFPVGEEAGRPSAIDTTCFVLTQLRDLPPLAGSPMASRAVAFLRRSQAVTGAWSEQPEVAALPQAYLTANAAYTLVVMEPSHIDPIARASKWLRGALGGEGEEPESQALFLAAAVWGRVLGAGSNETAWAYERLERLDLSASELSWWLSTLVELGVEARFLPLVLRQLQRLAGMQGEDGSWPGENAVEATLQALRVFRGFRLV